MKNYTISTHDFDNSVTIRGEVGAALIDAVRKGCNLIIEDNGHGAFTIKPNISMVAKNRAAREVMSIARRHATFSPTHGVTIVIVPVNGHTKVGHAVCAPGDEISAIVGEAIAYLRAVGKPVPFVLTA
jgi:hypothetical protein